MPSSLGSGGASLARVAFEVEVVNRAWREQRERARERERERERKGEKERERDLARVAFDVGIVDREQQVP